MVEGFLQALASCVLSNLRASSHALVHLELLSCWVEGGESAVLHEVHLLSPTWSRACSAMTLEKFLGHSSAPLPRIEFRHLQVVSMCNCSAWCMIARKVSKLKICRLRILHCLCQHGCEPEIFMFPRLSCVCMHLEMWVEVKVHSYHAHARVCMCVVVCVARKLRPCPSYSGRRDRNNFVHWCSLYKGVGGW